MLRYELSAVMVHEGDNADCGHYWDIIRHPHSGVWFKYNDKVRHGFTGFDANVRRVGLGAERRQPARTLVRSVVQIE